MTSEEFEIYLGEARKYNLILDEGVRRFRQNLPMYATLSPKYLPDKLRVLYKCDTDS